MSILKKGKAILDLGRVSNLPTVWSNVLASWWVCGGGDWIHALFLLAGASFVYVAGTTLNDAVDVEFDRKHRQERAIPSGVLSLTFVWGLGVFWMILGSGLMLAGGASLLWVVVLVSAILIYDWIHKKTPVGVIFMGLCRTALWLCAGSAAVNGEAAAIPWAVALGLYIVGLTFTARGESTGARLLGWPLMLLFAPALWAIGQRGGFAEWVFLFLGVVWIWYALRLLKSEGADRIGKSVSAMLAGIVLLDVLALSFVDWRLSFGVLVFFPMALGFQRWIAAT